MSVYLELTQPGALSEREKEDAMGAYFMMFAALASSLPLPIINLIAAVVYYYINRKKSRFIHFHCLQSLLSQLPTTALNWGLLFWLLQIYLFHNYEVNNYYYAYLFFAIVANLLYIIYSLVAALKARKGVFFYFLFFGPYACSRVYRKENTLGYENEKRQRNNAMTNTPPF